MKHCTYFLLFLMLIVLTLPLMAQEKNKKPPAPEPVLTPRPEMPPPAPPLPPDIEQPALNFVKELSKAKYEQIMKLKAVNEMVYKQELLHLYDEQKRLQELKEVDHERFAVMEQIMRLEAKSWELANKFKMADTANRESIKKELYGILAQLFDLKEADKAKEIQRIESDLKELKRTMDFRKNNKDKIIEKHLTELTGESPQMDW
jgi:hypothetical protein